MSQFINRREDIVTEAIDGLFAPRAAGWRGSTAIRTSAVVVRADWDTTGSRSSRAAARVTSRATPASSARACSRPPSAATSSRHPPSTRSWPASSPSPAPRGLPADRQELHRRPPELRPGRRARAGRSGSEGRDGRSSTTTSPCRICRRHAGWPGRCSCTRSPARRPRTAPTCDAVAEAGPSGSSTGRRSIGMSLNTCTVPGSPEGGAHPGRQGRAGPGHPRRARRGPGGVFRGRRRDRPGREKLAEAWTMGRMSSDEQSRRHLGA